MSLAKVITNGTGPVLRDFNFLESVTGPDEITFVAQNCGARTTYKKGDTVPGYSAMRVVETRSKLVPGAQYDITCRARGLISGSSRVIQVRRGSSAEGWDTITERRMEAIGTAIPDFGTAHGDYSTMFLMDHSDEELLDLGDGSSDWCQRDRTYHGLLNGVTKLIKRKITVNENIVNPKDPVVCDLSSPTLTGTKKVSASIPRVVVEDTILTTDAPPTDVIPGSSTPDDSPDVQTFTLTGDLTYNWPYGWKLASINDEELFKGAGVHRQTLVREFVWDAQF